MGRGGMRRSTWKKGEKPPVQKPKGTKNKRTRLKEALGLKNWSELAGYIDSNGIERCVKELSRLKGAAYVYAFLSLVEYVKPKLARKELVGDPDNPVHLKADLSGLSTQELEQIIALEKKLKGE